MSKPVREADKPGISIAELLKSDVYKDICTRFFEIRNIKLPDHIKKVIKLWDRYEKGFEFVPKDRNKYKLAIKAAGFEPDIRGRHLGIFPTVGSFAAVVTHGDGYREPGSPSLHCAIADDKSSVHLDNIGFRSGGYGEGYGPNSGQHVADELIWQANIVPFFGLFLPKVATDVLHRFHPVIPNSRQINPFSKNIGFEFDILKGRSADLQRQWRFTFDFQHACSDSTCGVLRKLINGKSFEGENNYTVNLKVTGL